MIDSKINGDIVVVVLKTKVVKVMEIMLLAITSFNGGDQIKMLIKIYNLLKMNIKYSKSSLAFDHYLKRFTIVYFSIARCEENLEMTNKMRPSVALQNHREAIREIALRHRVNNVHVFGSALHDLILQKFKLN